MNNLVVMRFHAAWCQPCKIYAGEFNRATKKLGVRTTEIDVDDKQNRELVEQYKVTSIPFTVILKDEVPVDQFAGAIAGSSLATRIIKASL